MQNPSHDGSLSTGHANSAADMLLRLETMVLMAASDLPLAAVRMQIASGLDIIVHLGRLRDRSRRVLEITEVLGYEDGDIRLNPLYRFEEDAGRAGDKDMRQTSSGKTGEKEKVKGCLRRTGDLVHREKLAAAGIRL